VTHLLLSYGLVLLFGLVAMESAGVPLPGETALIAAAVLATPKYHHYSIVWVIVVAAAGAIVGDNIGYWIGRTGGRALLEKWEPLARYTRNTLPRAERFFARHGGKTVFLARFIAVLRVTAAWVAGISRMHWWQFALWNAAGGIAWAVVVGLLAYEFGKAAADAIGTYGLYGAGVIAVILVLGYIGVRIWRHRLVESA
jgi:membrane-associated protein